MFSYEYGGFLPQWVCATFLGKLVEYRLSPICKAAALLVRDNGRMIAQ